MKKLILLASLLLAATQAMAVERYLGTTVIGDVSRGGGVSVNSCEGPRDQELRSITLVVRNEALNLRQVLVRLEDRSGRPGGFVVAQVYPGIYRAGQRIRVDLPGYSRCVQNVRIVGDSLDPNDGYRRPGRGGRRGPGPIGRTRPTQVDIYGDIVIPYRY